MTGVRMSDLPLDEPAEVQLTRRKSIPREAWRQQKGVAFAEAAITCPHAVLAFDRSMARGQWSHRFEAERGVRAGTPDMLIIARDGQAIHHIWIEWKADGNRPNTSQAETLSRLIELGDTAKWCTRIEELRRILTNCGLPMAPGADVMALRYDGLVDSRIAKAEAKAAGTVPKKKSRPGKVQPRFTAGARFVRRARGKGIGI